jgi:hypothetical protein
MWKWSWPILCYYLRILCNGLRETMTTSFTTNWLWSENSSPEYISIFNLIFYFIMLYHLQSYVVQSEKWYSEMVSWERCGNNNCGLLQGNIRALLVNPFQLQRYQNFLIPGCRGDLNTPTSCTAVHFILQFKSQDHCHYHRLVPHSS